MKSTSQMFVLYIKHSDSNPLSFRMRHIFVSGLLILCCFSVGMELKECCQRKLLGKDIYSLKNLDDKASTVFGCNSNCVYTREGEPDTEFCFKSGGDHQSVCQDTSGAHRLSSYL